MNCADVDILSILPQRPPMVMVDKLLVFTPDEAVTEFEVAPDNVFVTRDGTFGIFGLMENVAQTCAAKIGYYNKYILKNDVQIGVIGAVRDFVCNRCPRVGETLTTTVTTTQEVFGMTLVDGKVRCGNETVASCSMKIAIWNKEQC